MSSDKKKPIIITEESINELRKGVEYYKSLYEERERLGLLKSKCNKYTKKPKTNEFENARDQMINNFKKANNDFNKAFKCYQSAFSHFTKAAKHIVKAIKNK